MAKRLMNGLTHFYVPFERVDDEARTVEGYCYTKGTVKSDKWNLKRATLEAAAPGYLEFPAVREMHQMLAAGKTDAVQFDDKGCVIRVKVVDDQAWQKVKEGVYRGFSIGGRPVVVRGNEIEKFDWQETSLVDRPADPGAVFTVVRGEQADAEYEVEVLEVEREEEAVVEQAAVEETLTDVERAIASETAPTRENLEGKPKGDTHYDCGAKYGCCGHVTRGGAQECMERQGGALDQHISDVEAHLEAMKAKRRAEEPELERAEETPEMTTPPLPDAATEAPADLLSRVDTLPADAFPTFTSTILTRLEAAESGLAEERQLHAATKERAETLAKRPTVTPPVRFPQALERTFAANDQGEMPDRGKLQDELQRVETEGKEAGRTGDVPAQNRCFDRMQALKHQLSFLGDS